MFRPSLGAEELAAVSEVFASNWLGYGARAKAFEAEFAAHLDVPAPNVLFINSCTAGLFLAARMLDLGPQDDVVLPSVSFVAAANAIAATGARPVFCDVDPRTLNPSIEDIERAVTPRTKAVLVLHYGGYPGNIASIAAFCRNRGLRLIEDAACAVDSRVDGKACGSFGDIAMWSFDAMKILVTGDGGMLYTRDDELAAKARGLAYHGLAQSSGFVAAKVSHRWWELDVRDFGGRMIGNDLTAAIGSVQLRNLPQAIGRRREIVEQYDQLLAGVPGVVLPPPLPEGHSSSYYFYWVQLDPRIRDVVAAGLLERGIYTTFRYPPLHKVPAYQADVTPLPATEAAADATLLLPLHHGLADAEVKTVAAELTELVTQHRVEGR
ncbi:MULTISPECIES: DegT/DnrJ/EryC1/StrS family aminotransferase [unclassified Crossiella]|uniref:DegT/DnrJ/EryC1/StrS aminotransferase family protein n=1 Tax=unclassified Crossiella TaxID=2620835 RepID=UPI001FFFCF9A|nr:MULTISPECIES: DegT/DnrJ/EryC1/StrS family aminotransferase [unclassified Crossiella]MCK2244436.1 DegT/DnrJ/EryC1/StrS family aminotransferase [Crossiella sp. S99.2]MCK2257736.1 DegT/DnrJ/EryC1/StrS family aminotransferase [Crossiella sp. S99.1]